MTEQLVRPFTDEFVEFLRDESRRTGTADSISFPRTEADIRAALKAAHEAGEVVTVQGARTGITAGAVPEGGHILNVSRMARMLGVGKSDDGRFTLRVQPGVLLSDVTARLVDLAFETDSWGDDDLAALEALKAAGPQMFTPDPTETSATIGGMVACNASGARSFRYGPTRAHVAALRAVLSDGRVAALRRGEQKASGRHFVLTLEEGTSIEGDIPAYTPPAVKSAAGYHAEDDMDLVDLFVGMEGTLGVVSEIEIALVPRPSSVWGLMMFMPDEPGAISLVRAIRGEAVDGVEGAPDPSPVAIELFNHAALNLLRSQKESNQAFADIPDLPAEYHTAIYAEFHGDDEDTVTEAVMAASEALVVLGGDEDATWVADNEREMERLKFFRHAVPESVNLLIDTRRREQPELTKLGTDMSVPDERLVDVLHLYQSDLDKAGLESVVFGHIGNNHVHVNILPRTMDEYARGKELYLAWAREVVAMGGSVSAEHGIGKLKVDFLRLMYGEENIEQMRTLRGVFDPSGMLNRGNLFT